MATTTRVSPITALSYAFPSSFQRFWDAAVDPTFTTAALAWARGAPPLSRSFWAPSSAPKRGAAARQAQERLTF